MIETKLIVSSDFTTEKLEKEINEFLIELDKNSFVFLDIKLDIMNCCACVIYTTVNPIPSDKDAVNAIKKQLKENGFNA